jgi:hypothetical protein
MSRQVGVTQVTVNRMLKDLGKHVARKTIVRKLLQVAAEETVACAEEI